MAYLAQTLITRSWYLSGIVARNLQFVTGDQINDGLMLLNALLDFKQIEIDLIPYWTYIEIPCVPGQEFYFLPNVAAVESVTFNLDVVRYPMNSVTRSIYYGSPRVDNISTLPFSYNYNRSLGGGNLALYFLPSQNFPLKLMVKIFLVDVSLSTDLTNIATAGLPYTFINSANQGYDTSYIEYLRYELANYMADEYGVSLTPSNMARLAEYRRMLMDVEPPDLSIMKASILNSDQAGIMTWGFVNLGRGWIS
jgi:hypothetical protein